METTRTKIVILSTSHLRRKPCFELVYKITLMDAKVTGLDFNYSAWYEGFKLYEIWYDS